MHPEKRGRPGRLRSIAGRESVGSHASRDGVSFDAVPLEQRTLFSASALLLDSIDLDSFEDAPDQNLDLERYFSVDDSGTDVKYSVASQTGDPLLDRITINDAGLLRLSFVDNQHGDATLTILADDQAGGVEALPIHIDLESINDAPTTTGVLDISVAANTERTVIDLYASFDDVEDGSSGLSYSVTHNSNAALFDEIKINQQQGRLILEHAAGKTGFADLTVVATDSGGLSVGMSTNDGFAVYNQIYGVNGTSPDTSQLGLKPLDLWTGFRFFDRVDGSYQTDRLAKDKFESILTDPQYTDPTHAHVFNLETPDHVNTPEGRDNFAELLGFSKTVNPDLEIGVYRIMPERSWSYPVYLRRGLDETELGINTFSSRSVDFYEAEIVAWQARNALFRTEPVSEQFGGGTVAELIDTTNPSLYTPKLEFAEHWRLASLDADANTVTVIGSGPAFDDVETVQLEIATDATLSNRLQRLTDYYLVNTDGMTFQLATTPGGNPIDFDADFSGRIYAAATGDLSYTFHDSNVRYWNAYAEDNIAEARKFGKPVYAWISPSVSALGVEQLDYDFFRWQLEVLRPLADGIVVYQSPAFEGSYYVQQSWWQALTDFMGTLDQPANEFRVSVGEVDQNNESPVARNDAVTASEDTPVVWKLTELLGNDVDSDKLDLDSFTQPQHGTLTQLLNGSLRYEPDDDYNGADQFRYRVTDGNSVSNSAVVRVHVNSVNDRPIAEGETFATGDGEALFLGPKRLLANDVDVDEDKLGVRVFEGPRHGVLTRNANGIFIYTPNSQFVGQDEIQYQAFDGVAKSKAATVVINVIAENDPPVAGDDRLRIEEDQSILIHPSRFLKNDRDPEGDDLSLQIVKGPIHGTLQQQPDGKLLYTPKTNFRGTDEFFYRADDGEFRSNLARVIIPVTPVNDNPAAAADKLVTTEDTPLSFRDQRLLRNDVDADGDDLRIVIVDQPEHGSLRRGRNGTFAYSPRPNFHGFDQFGYRLTDGEGRSDVVAVQIRVDAENDRPRAMLDQFTAHAGRVLRVDADGVLGNDRDADRDQLQARLFERPRHGSLKLNSDGSFDYRPQRGFQGIDQFRYVASDGNGGGSVGTVRIQVAATASATAGSFPSHDDDSSTGSHRGTDAANGSGLNARIEALLRNAPLPKSVPRPRR